MDIIKLLACGEKSTQECQLISCINIKDITDYTITCNIFDVSTWYPGKMDRVINPDEQCEFFASAYIKCDLCTHWNFRGMDYLSIRDEAGKVDKNRDPEKDGDSYYHLCGLHSYNKFSFMMLFAMKVAHNHFGDKAYEGEWNGIDFSPIDKYTIANDEILDENIENYFLRFAIE